MTTSRYARLWDRVHEWQVRRVRRSVQKWTDADLTFMANVIADEWNRRGNLPAAGQKGQ